MNGVYLIQIFQVCVMYCLHLDYCRIQLCHNHIFESRIKAVARGGAVAPPKYFGKNICDLSRENVH